MNSDAARPWLNPGQEEQLQIGQRGPGPHLFPLSSFSMEHTMPNLTQPAAPASPQRTVSLSPAHQTRGSSSWRKLRYWLMEYSHLTGEEAVVQRG